MLQFEKEKEFTAVKVTPVQPQSSVPQLVLVSVSKLKVNGVNQLI